MLRIPATFSPMTQRGFVSEIRRSMCGQRKRSSASPLRFPARLNGWQGKPPVRRSIGPSCRPSSSLMSPYISELGKCCLRSPWHNRSISQKTCSTLGQVQSAARAKPPMPLNKSRCLILGGSETCARLARRRTLQSARLIMPVLYHPCAGTALYMVPELWTGERSEMYLPPFTARLRDSATYHFLPSPRP